MGKKYTTDSINIGDHNLDASMMASLNTVVSNHGSYVTSGDIFSGNYNDLTNKPAIPSLNGYATQSYVTTQINNLVASAPGSLNTLNELAAALGDDANFSTTVTNSIAAKLPLAGGTMTGNLTVPQIITTHNGSGTNIRIGDDAWIGDTNVANTIQITGSQDGTKGYIVFGSSDNMSLGRSGTGNLTYGGYSVFHDNYHPNADKWTTARTLSLSGDASGSVSWDGSANATLSVTVNDNSHSHSNYLVNNGNSSSTGYIQAEGFVGSGGTGTHILAPHGAHYATQSSSVTGAIKITLPQSWTNTMLRFTVKVYEYTTGESFDIVCAGYNHTSAMWYNTSAYILSDTHKNRNFTVRFGHDGSKCCVYIGETNSSWSYPQVSVTEFYAGYSSYSAETWNDNWAVGFATSLGPITSTRTNNEVGRYVDGNIVWHAGNDGSGSGLDADKLDGQHGSYYLDYNNLSNKPTIPTVPNSYAPTDAEANVQADWTETTTTSDAFILNKPTTFAPSAHNHDDRYYTESEVNSLLAGKQASGTYNTIIGTDSDLNTAGSTIIDNIYVTDGVITSMGTRTLTPSDIGAALSSHSHSWNSITSKPTTFAPSAHNHDDRYYTETESDSRFVNVTGDTITGGLTIGGSLSRSTYTSASNYHAGADNIVLKGNNVGISGIFFESEKNGTNINHSSDFGFIQYHAYGTGTSGESNELIIGVSNDSDDHLILNAPHAEGLRFRVGSSETDYKIYHEGHKPTASEIGAAASSHTHSEYLATTGKAADANLLDGINSTSFLRSDVADTMTGTLTIDTGASSNALVIKGTSPTISFLDDDGGDDFYIHTNSNNFFVLANRDANDLVGTGWESPYPLQLAADTNIGYLFANRIFAENYHPNADTLTTARTIAGTSFNGSANIDINYNNLTNKPTIPSGSSLVKVYENQNYVASSSSTSNRFNYGAGLTVYEGYSGGANRPHTYDTTLQIMATANHGFEMSADWVSSSTTPLKIRSLRDCCQGWSSWRDVAVAGDVVNGNFLFADNVGIGTTSPSDKLHVSGNLRVTGAFKDSSGDSGIPGQILSSTGSGTNWINNATGDITGVTAGSGLTGGGTSGAVTLSHADTSSQGSVDNSSGTVIQDITLDTYGHITGLASYNLDGRYYTKSSADSRYYLDSNPDGYTSNIGDITAVTAGTNLNGGGTSGAVTLNLDSTINLNEINIGQGIELKESTDRADLLQITSATSTWGGIQVRNSADDGRWSFMTDGPTGGFYDDQNGDWAVQMIENGSVRLYNNSSERLTTTPVGVTVYGTVTVNDNIVHNGDSNTYVGFPQNDTWRVVTAGSERLRVDSNGNVGIGATIPGSLLHVEGSRTTAALQVNQTGIGAIVNLKQGGNSKVLIDNSGRVGIGTTNPQVPLQVSQGVNNTPTIFRLENQDNSIETNQEVNTIQFYTNDFSGFGTGISSKITQFAANPGNQYGLSFHTYDVGLAERMRLTHDGKVGIGTTSPGAKLDVNGSIRASTSGGLLVNTQYGAKGIRAYYGSLYFDTNVYIGGVNGTSYTSIRASAFTVSSDYRLKTNVVDLEEAIEKIKQINVHRFNWKDRLDEEKVDGFLAHELAEVIPEAVIGEKDAVREDGTLDYQGVDQSKVVPLLTAALKEAIEKIEQLENRIQTLENN